MIGEVVNIIMNDDLLSADGYVDHEKANTLTVSGLDSYFKPKHLARLAYAKAEQTIQITK